jgi:hypothetical protein
LGWRTSRPLASGSPVAIGPASGRLPFALFVLAAGVCSLLALANAPIGPTSYSPALTGLRPLVENASTLVIASPQLLADEQGAPYISWELRGGRVCIEAEGKPDRFGSVANIHRPPPGVRFVVTGGDRTDAPFTDVRIRRVVAPYVLWESIRPVRGHSPCPLIAERQARQGSSR